MTTPDELRTMLQSLAEYCALIEQDLQDSAYPAAASSNAGARPIGPKGKPPCSIVDLDFIIEDVAPRIKGWCFNLQESAHIIGLPVNQPLNVWVAWLSRHRVTLLDQDWGEDAADELTDLTAQLRDRLHPNPDTKRPDVGEFATAEDIAHATGRSVASVKKWCQRNKVEHWDIGGVRQYRTSQVHYQYEHHKLA
ncbi:hypothetical protein [Corynebacterium sp. AOP40-4SA-5]|uniref:hypothetical protein n=1 Tax=Corynebacterium sp. AOP40-4SA-5 TaxID=3457678 RepID=UPI004033ED34